MATSLEVKVGEVTDFTTWTEIDPNNDLSQTSSKASWTDMEEDQDCRLYKAIYSGINFSYKLDFQLTSIDINSGPADYNLACIWQVCESQGRPFFVETGRSINLSIFEQGSSTTVFYLYLSHKDDNVQDTSIDLNVGTTYYLTITKVGAVVTCTIYSDSNRTVTVDTISIDLTGEEEEDMVFDYVQTTAAANYYSVTDQSDGWVENLDYVRQLDCLRAELDLKTINQGHQIFTLVVDNYQGKYNESIRAQDKIEIYIEDILFLKGYIDSVKHVETQENQWSGEDYLRITGRDLSQDLSNKKIIKTYSSTLKLGQIINDAVSETEITPPTAQQGPVIDGYTADDEYILDLVRKVLEQPMVNWEGYVDTGKTLNIFSMGSNNTGLTIDVALSSDFIEEDGLDIRNNIEVKGAAILTYPEKWDEWTEYENFLFYLDNNKYYAYQTSYELRSSCTLNPGESGTLPVNITEVELQLIANGTGYYKITYQKEGGTETDIVTDQEFTSYLLTWEKRTHSTNILGDANKYVIVRYYAKRYGPEHYFKVRKFKTTYSALEPAWEVNTGSMEFDGRSGWYQVGIYSLLFKPNSGFSQIVTTLDKPFRVREGEHTEMAFWYRNGMATAPSEWRIKLLCNPLTNATDYFYLDPDDNPLTWIWRKYSLGPQYVYDAEDNPDGIWTKVGNADWFNIVAIEFRWDHAVTDGWFNLDGLYLIPRRTHGEARDILSEDYYGERKLSVTDNSKRSNEECQALAEALVDEMKDPLKKVRITIPGSDFIVDNSYKGLPGYYLKLELPSLDIDDNYRLTNIKVSVAPYINLRDGHDFVITFDAVPNPTVLDADRYEKLREPRAISYLRGK